MMAAAQPMQPLPLPPLPTCTVAVIGLGYVGLPLAVAFGTPGACVRTGAPLRRRVIGFDINTQRLTELREGIDRTNETSAEELQAATLLELSSDPALLAAADVFVVTVPTPIDDAKRPDLTPLEKASAAVGQALNARAAAGAQAMPVVIYESTVYPGATEEVCVPIVERTSGLRFNEGFGCGYSPERINPGDTEHKLTTITKVTSGSTPEVASWVDGLYGSIIEAGTHRAASLKVAEAAKVIENTQRDLNIALVNELAMIFARLGIDTGDVLAAAGTKWNFLPFRPDLLPPLPRRLLHRHHPVPRLSPLRRRIQGDGPGPLRPAQRAGRHAPDPASAARWPLRAGSALLHPRHPAPGAPVEPKHSRGGTHYSPALEQLLGPARQSDQPLEQRHKNIARSAQAMYEEAFFHLLRALHQRHPADELCIAGGCGANSVANGKVTTHTPFRQLYVQAAAGDAGGALGAALEVWHQLGHSRCQPMVAAYLGSHPAPGPRLLPAPPPGCLSLDAVHRITAGSPASSATCSKKPRSCTALPVSSWASTTAGAITRPTRRPTCSPWLPQERHPGPQRQARRPLHRPLGRRSHQVLELRHPSAVPAAGLGCGRRC